MQLGFCHCVLVEYLPVIRFSLNGHSKNGIVKLTCDMCVRSIFSLKVSLFNFTTLKNYGFYSALIAR